MRLLPAPRLISNSLFARLAAKGRKPKEGVCFVFCRLASARLVVSSACSHQVRPPKGRAPIGGRGGRSVFRLSMWPPTMGVTDGLRTRMDQPVPWDG